MHEHKKAFGVYHWDTFDNETFLVGEADTFEQAEKIVQKEYAGRIYDSGADQVDIVNARGDIVKVYKVG